MGVLERVSEEKRGGEVVVKEDERGPEWWTGLHKAWSAFSKVERHSLGQAVNRLRLECIFRIFYSTFIFIFSLIFIFIALNVNLRENTGKLRSVVS